MKDLWKRVVSCFKLGTESIYPAAKSDYALGFLWIGLGLATWFNSKISDVISIGGPIVVGIVCIIPKLHRRHGLYYVLAFSVAADRVVSYTVDGLWNPFFVWSILGVYMLKSAEKTAHKGKNDPAETL